MPHFSSQDEILQSRSRLLQLPGEVRNQILRHVVTQPEPIALRRLGSSFTIDVNVLHTCRQLRDEARFFLYNENTLEIEIDSLRMITSLHFSKRHSICEYRAEEAIAEVSVTFLERFSRFQFRFLDARRLGSLHRAIGCIKHCFKDKHVTVILPLPKSARAGDDPLVLAAPRLRKYPQLHSPLLPFSLLRCMSFSVRSEDPDYDPTQHEKLVDLVMSDRPIVDMARLYEDAQRSARAVDRMLVPIYVSAQGFDTLRVDVFESMWTMCESAGRSDQDAFLLQAERFENCYRHIQELQ